MSQVNKSLAKVLLKCKIVCKRLCEIALAAIGSEQGGGIHAASYREIGSPNYIGNLSSKASGVEMRETLSFLLAVKVKVVSL